MALIKRHTALSSLDEVKLDPTGSMTIFRAILPDDS